MSENQATYLKKATPSPRYFGMWPGMQDSSDGRTQLLDISGNGRHLNIGPGGSYAAVTGTAKWASVVGAAQPTDKTLYTTDALPWDMFLGQSLIVSWTNNAAAPGSTAHTFNARGATANVQGMSILSDNLGRPTAFVRDTATTTTVVASSGVIFDGTDKTNTFMIDGTNKLARGYTGTTPWSATGTAGVSLAGSTAGTTLSNDPMRWGGAGDFVAASQGTWVNGATLLLRNMHVLVLDYWPSNYLDIVAELAQNPQRPLSERLVP